MGVYLDSGSPFELYLEHGIVHLIWFDLVFNIEVMFGGLFLISVTATASWVEL